MKSLLDKFIGSRALLKLGAVLSFILVIYGSEILLSPSRLSSVSKSYEGYSWSMVQFQINFERMSAQVVKYSSGLDKSVDALVRRHSELSSNFQALIKLSRQIGVLDQIPNYEDDMQILVEFMSDVASGLHDAPQDARAIQNLAMRIEEVRPTVNELSNRVHAFELTQSSLAFDDFVQKRKNFYFLNVALWAFFLLWLALNVRRTRKLLEKEKKASAMAHDAIFSKNNFLGMISHELRTPLQTILSSIDLIALKAPGLGESDVMKRLSSAAEHLEMQLRDLTDLARLDAGKLTLRELSFDPNELIEMVVADFKPVAEGKGLSISADLDKNLGMVVSDAYRIQQIVNNLTSNAIKYTDRGRIVVRVRFSDQPSPQLLIAVEDTGIGISAEYLPDLFRPFMQIEQGNTRRRDGVGMGLAIVKRLLELFEGEIRVQTTLHVGSRFEARIPVKLEDGKVAETKGISTLNKRMNPILIVDDHSDIRNSFKEVLEGIGYRSEVVGSGAEALQKIASHKYAAILLDIQMPELDGFAVAAAIREHSGFNQHVPIVAISAYPSHFGDAERNKLFDDYLSKPVRSDVLGSTLKKLLR
ncbi:hypothetical protein RB25_11715 [Herbaspirillum rubrisubalbicans]|uniref:ATP-binding response regulator n=1 Tax=Herbaspirillum rubrisubalbicans TaxID=80842 RepID=UPI000DC3CB48|nr:ATP-binding protein [Herbaspirillum rubrisubalbicans]RAN48441.1 hypothetical protein RB25_11715 [Herbaspirillum rubrisubalbicans]